MCTSSHNCIYEFWDYKDNQAVLEHGDNVQLDFYFFEDVVRVTKSGEATSYWVNFLCRIEFCL